MKLYGFPMSPNSRRAQLTLEELGLPYEYVTVDLMTAAQKAPEYLAVNPFGRVPTLVDGDFTLWESHAILEYLVAKHPESGLGPKTPVERGDISRWMFLNAAHFGPANAAIFAHTIRLPEDQRIPKLAENGKIEGNRILGVMNAALEGKTFLVGERLTIADLSIAPAVMFAPMLGFDLSAYPNVAAWIERLKARPAFKKAMG
jgi:glutathione S-transferase